MGLCVKKIYMWALNAGCDWPAKGCLGYLTFVGIQNIIAGLDPYAPGSPLGPLNCVFSFFICDHFLTVYF